MGVEKPSEQEIWNVLKAHKMWWLIPLMVALFLLMGIIILSAGGTLLFSYAP